MALSPAAIRAIAIRRKSARTAPVAANDNGRSARYRAGARVMSTAQLEACLASSGHAEHASR